MENYFVFSRGIKKDKNNMAGQPPVKNDMAILTFERTICIASNSLSVPVPRPPKSSLRIGPRDRFPNRSRIWIE
jgi:hypothetical protein